MDDDYYHPHGWDGVYTKLDVWIIRIMNVIIAVIIIGAILLLYVCHTASVEYDEKYCNGSSECRRMMSRAPIRVYVENGCIANGQVEVRK